MNTFSRNKTDTGSTLTLTEKVLNYKTLFFLQSALLVIHFNQ